MATQEGELYGELYLDDARIPRGNANYWIRLTPVGETIQKVAAMQSTGNPWNPYFRTTNHSQERDWEWFNEYTDGDCDPNAPRPEIHGAIYDSPVESHCIIPGRYTISLIAGDSTGPVVRQRDIDFLGGKRVPQAGSQIFVQRLIFMPFWDPNRNPNARLAPADEEFLNGSSGGILRYVSGDTPIVLDVGSAAATPQPTLAVGIENVGAVPYDSVYVPMTQLVAGADDILRVNLHYTPNTYAGTTGVNLFRLSFRDAAGTRTITAFYSVVGGWEHLRLVRLADQNPSGCPELGIQLILPDQTVPGPMTWHPILGVNGCGAPQAPNLLLSGASLPTGWTVGQTVASQVTVQNVGQTGVVTSQLELFLSEDESLGIEDSKIYTGAVPALGSGGSAIVGASFTVPNVPAGSRRLIAIVDGERRLPELVEADNLWVSPPVPVVGLADLTIPAYAPGTLALGTSITMTYTANNVGGQVATPPWMDRFYLSPDATLNKGTDTLIGTVAVAQSLAANQPAQRAVTLTAPPTYNVGTRRLIGSIDDDGQVPESNEANNLSTSPTISIVYAPGKDLAAISLAATQGGIGFTNIVFVARNIGSQSVSCTSPSSRYYLSLDTLVSSDDYRTAPYLSPCPRNSGVYDTLQLNFGKTFSSFKTGPTWSVPVPPGTYHLLGKVDSEGAQVESNENNNVARRPNLVVVP